MSIRSESRHFYICDECGCETDAKCSVAADWHAVSLFNRVGMQWSICGGQLHFCYSCSKKLPKAIRREWIKDEATP